MTSEPKTVITESTHGMRNVDTYRGISIEDDFGEGIFGPGEVLDDALALNPESKVPNSK